MSRSCWQSATDASVEVVAAGSNTFRQRRGAQSIPVDRRLADEHPAGAQQRHNQWCDFRRERPTSLDVAGRGVEMGERDPACQPLADRLESIAHVANEEEFRGG